jgi:hypothetical protein
MKAIETILILVMFTLMPAVFLYLVSMNAGMKQGILIFVK